MDGDSDSEADSSVFYDGEFDGEVGGSVFHDGEFDGEVDGPSKCPSRCPSRQNKAEIIRISSK